MKGVTVVAWALVVSLLTPTTDAQNFPFNPEDLLQGAFDLTRSGTPSLTCSTPEGQQGLCGSATTCSAYQSLLNNLQDATVLNFFRMRVCRQSPGVIHICCPFRESPQGAAGPKGTSIMQPPGILFHRPSQRPNARQPAQGGFRDPNDDEEDEEGGFQDTPILPTDFPPATHQPQIPPTARPRPTFPPTTTTPAPAHVPSQLPPSTSTGIFIIPDKVAPVPGSQNPSDPTSQTQDPFPTEPPRPIILPAEEECGTTVPGRTGVMPWVVGVGVLDKGGFQVICGGALISHLHVIVAAHCLHSSTSQLTYVRLGDLQHAEATMDTRLLASATHPAYNPATRENDVALLTLSNPVTFNENIRPVCLPFRYRLDGFQGQEVQVVGWGGGDGLEVATVQVIGLGKCRKVYQSPSHISNNKVPLFSRSSSSSFSINPRGSSSLVVDRRHLCGSPAPSASSSTRSTACVSDHGAPLFYNDQDTTKRHFLVGVSSLGDGCEAGPGLYTRVGAFLPWLVKQLGTVEVSSTRPVPVPVLSPRRHGG